ncbi:MAG: hypothetical protein K0R47_2388, partial [Brevibacillus sp.]|nr:hypothetical protein [Brevibacillus sp.]
MAVGSFRRVADLATFFALSKGSYDEAHLKQKWLGTAFYCHFH